jgi:hypothetical protein
MKATNGKIILVRGVSGSGKTTLATSLCWAIDLDINSIVIAADDYFYHDQKYLFDPSKLHEAHSQCLSRAREFMQNEKDYPSPPGRTPILFVTNTFTREWEMKSYFDLAEEFGWVLHSIIVENRHGGNNVHGVPEKKIEEMRNRFEIKL